MKRILIALALTLWASLASAQTGSGGPWTKILFGGTTGSTLPILTAASDCTAVTANTGSICTDTDDGNVWRKSTGSWVQITGSGGTGTVSSVALSLPSIFTISGSPVTGTGTLTGDFAAQTANRIFAGPSTGANAAPTFRTLVLDDIPSITSAKITDATITFGDWASNSCASGEVPTSNGSTWACGAGGGGSGAPTGAQYLTLATDATLTNERVLTAGDIITLTDAGAGSTLTVKVTPTSDDQVYVGNGTVMQAKSVPDCDDVSGSHLNYDTATNAWSCGNSGGAASGFTDSVGITVDGGGAVITTGVKGFVPVPYTGTIIRATLLSTDASATAGSIVFDVWKDTYANYPPTVADTITASAKPTLSSANKSDDSTLTGWTTSVTAGDILGFKVDSASTVTRVTLVLRIQR